MTAPDIIFHDPFSDSSPGLQTVHSHAPTHVPTQSVCHTAGARPARPRHAAKAVETRADRIDAVSRELELLAMRAGIPQAVQQQVSQQ